MAEKVDSVMRYSPGNCTPGFLEKILVGQHELVNRLEKSVLDSIQTGAGHHWLLVGTRGSGKTHLLAILFNRIDKNQAVRERVAVAYMKEEERGVATFLDWLVRILRAFERREETSYQLSEDLVRLTQLPLDQAETEALRLLLHSVGDKKLLLIVENLGEIFSESKGMGKKGQRRFRDLVQQHPFWTIMASSQNLFEDVQKQEAPFYGFFKIHHLGTFSFEQTIELLGNLATSESRDHLKNFFRTPAGQGRIRAIHEITGGNPRLLVIFYQVIDHESIADLAGSFLEMVDNLTVYYQEQMQPLSALQQKILEFLCEHRSPATVKKIAQSCFITSQTASKQLERLLNYKMLNVTRVDRQSYYELREPLFRICFEVKENMGYPIQLFIDFLGKFYSIEELKRKYKSTNVLLSVYQCHGAQGEAKKLGTELSYIEQAMLTYHNTRLEEIRGAFHGDKAPDDKEIFTIIDELVSSEDYREAVKVADVACKYEIGGTESLMKSAIACRRAGEFQKAHERLEHLLQVDPNNANAWVEKAAVEIACDDQEAAENSYHRAIKIADSNVKAHMGLGILYWRRKNYESALKYFKRVAEFQPENAKGWLNLAKAQEYTKDVKGARQSYYRATQLAPDNVDMWNRRGFFERAQGAFESALECFQHVTKLQPEIAASWHNLGIVQENAKDAEGARNSYRKATELDPENAHNWIHRGSLEINQKAFELALKYLTRATELGTKDVKGWLLLGVVQEEMRDMDGARKSYLRTTELDPKNADAWGHLGVLELHQEAFKLAMQYFICATELQPEDPRAWRFLGIVQEKMKDIEGARETYRKVTELIPKDASAWLHRGSLEANQKAFKVAQECFEQVINLQPTDPQIWLQLGIALEKMNEIEDARKSYRKATELDLDDAHAWTHRGILESSQKAYELARQYFKRATELEPENAQSWVLLGVCQENARDIEGARNSYRKVTELDSNDSDALLRWGSLEFNEGNHEVALDLLRKAEVLAPPSSDFYNLLGEAFREMNRYEQAIVHYKKAIDLDQANCFAHFNIALALFELRDFDKGIQQIERAIAAGVDRDWADPVVISVNDINDYLLRYAPTNLLPTLIKREREIFDGGSFSKQFSEGMTGALTELLKQHREIPLERLLQLREGIVTELAKEDQFKVVCRMFDTGVRFIQTENMQVLLELPLEERSTLQKILNENEAS